MYFKKFKNNVRDIYLNILYYLFSLSIILILPALLIDLTLIMFSISLTTIFLGMFSFLIAPLNIVILIISYIFVFSFMIFLFIPASTQKTFELLPILISKLKKDIEKENKRLYRIHIALYYTYLNNSITALPDFSYLYFKEHYYYLRNLSCILNQKKIKAKKIEFLKDLENRIITKSLRKLEKCPELIDVSSAFTLYLPTNYIKESFNSLLNYLLSDVFKPAIKDLLKGLVKFGILLILLNQLGILSLNWDVLRMLITNIFY